MNEDMQRDKTGYSGWGYRQIGWWIGENVKMDERMD